MTSFPTILKVYDKENWRDAAINRLGKSQISLSIIQKTTVQCVQNNKSLEKSLVQGYKYQILHLCSVLKNDWWYAMNIMVEQQKSTVKNS